MFGRRDPVAEVGSMREPVRRFVQERVARRLGIAADEAVVRIERRGTTYLVSVEGQGVTSRCVVCPRIREDHIQDAGELQRVHGVVRGGSEELARGLPMVLDVEPQQQWVVFEYLAGAPLLEVLKTGLRRGNVQSGLEALRQTGCLLAQINGFSAAKLGLGQPLALHAEYVRQMDLCTADPLVRRWLPEDGCWQAALARVTGEDFEKRYGDRLMLVDCQPKNVLVTEAGDARCIDIDYATGSPALNVAHFLISLDRLGLRHPQARRQRLLAECKAAFVQAYLEVGEPWIGQDLAFFYAWLLMRCIRQHANLHPLLGGYIRRSYGRRLQRLLRGLETGLPIGDWMAAPVAA